MSANFSTLLDFQNYTTFKFLKMRRKTPCSFYGIWLPWMGMMVKSAGLGGSGREGVLSPFHHTRSTFTCTLWPGFACFPDLLPQQPHFLTGSWVEVLGEEAYLLCLPDTLKKIIPKGEKKVLICWDNLYIKKSSPSRSLPGPLLSVPWPPVQLCSVLSCPLPLALMVCSHLSVPDTLHIWTCCTLFLACFLAHHWFPWAQTSSTSKKVFPAQLAKSAFDH